MIESPVADIDTTTIGLALRKDTAMSQQQSASALPPLCYIRHPTSGKTVAILRGEDGYREIDTLCSPDCLNAKLSPPPTGAQINAMKHGSMFGWDTPGADPKMWERAAAAGAR